MNLRDHLVDLWYGIVPDRRPIRELIARDNRQRLIRGKVYYNSSPHVEAHSQKPVVR
jgi:hypothetical protein